MSTKKKATSWFKRTVEVTEKNLLKAHKLRGENRDTECPVALALRGLKLRGVSVCCDEAEATLKGKAYKADLPKKVKNFIAAFDKGRESAAKLKPFSFKLKFVSVLVED